MQRMVKLDRASPDALDALPKLVGASLLLRLRPAPKVPSAENNMFPAPKYGCPPTYDTSQIQISRAERGYFDRWEKSWKDGKWNLSQPGPEPSIRDALITELEEDKIPAFLDLNFGAADTEPTMLDFNRALCYNPEQGFNVSIDCVHRIKKDIPLAVVHYVNGEKDDCHFTTERQWDSLARSPRFTQTWIRYRPNGGAILILDVRMIDFNAAKKGKSCVLPLGWTFLPLFDDAGFFLSGSYQLPLIEGAVNTEFLAEPSFKLMLEWLNDKSKAKTFKLDKSASIFVRVRDAQRDMHFSSPIYKDADKTYIKPFDVRNYLYDRRALGTKTMADLVPKKMTVDEYERKINLAVAEETEIKRYLF